MATTATGLGQSGFNWDDHAHLTTFLKYQQLEHFRTQKHVAQTESRKMTLAAANGSRTTGSSFMINNDVLLDGPSTAKIK